MVLRKYELEAKLKDDQQLISTGVLRNEHPLDASTEFTEFLEACRRGDLRHCQEMISAGVNINAKDRFDYTPLIIVRAQMCASTWSRCLLLVLQASLCGHFELVRLLLESGTLVELDPY